MPETPLRLVLDPVDAELEATLECEAAVFLETYGNTPHQWRQEYDAYAGQTGFLAVLDERGSAVAALRYITPGPAGLKTLNDVSRPPWGVDGVRSARAAGIDPVRTWDIATIAVRRGHGYGGMSAAALYHGLFRATRENDAPWIVMIMDERARRLLHAAGVGVRALPATGAAEYLGSPNSTPLWGHLPSLAEQQRRTSPESFRLLHHGIGLDGVKLPTRWTRRPGPLLPVAAPALAVSAPSAQAGE